MKIVADYFVLVDESTGRNHWELLDTCSIEPVSG